MSETEKELAKCIHILTTSVADSFRIQAEICTQFAIMFPEHRDALREVAERAKACSLNLTQNLPPLPID